MSCMFCEESNWFEENYSPLHRVAPAMLENDKIANDVKLRALPFLWCSLALFLGSCAKRKTATRIVYVPSPPPAATQATAEGTPSIVIEEPAPPEPPAPAPQPTAPPAPARKRRVRRTEPPAAAADDTGEDTTETTEPAPTPQVPSLEPRESSTQEAALRHQIQGLQDDVRPANRQTQPSATIRCGSQNPRRCAYLLRPVHSGSRRSRSPTRT